MRVILKNLDDVKAEVILAKLQNAKLLMLIGQMGLAKDKLYEILEFRYKWHFFTCV